MCPPPWRRYVNMTDRPTIELEVGIEVDKAAVQRALARDGYRSLTVRFLAPRQTVKAFAKLLAAEPRPSLRTVELLHEGFESDSDPGRAMLGPADSERFLHALPSLESLRLVGHSWCKTLSHPRLKSLDLDGFCFGTTGSLMRQPLGCPALERLRWCFGADGHGVALSAGQLKGLWSAEGLPNLVDLDLLSVDLDGDLFRARSFLTSALLPQLRRLTAPALTTDSKTLKRALPKLQHLEQLRVGDAALLQLDDRIELVEPEAVAPPAEPTEHYVGPESVEDGAVWRLGLAKQPCLRSITLRHHWLESEGPRVIGRLAKQHPELESLDLSEARAVGITAEGIAGLQEELGHHPGITTLRLNGNGFDGCGEHMAKLLGQLPNLEVLDLSKSRLTGADLQCIVPAVNALPRLRTLNAAGNDNGGEVARAWGRLTSASLETLVLWTLRLEPSETAPFFDRMGERLPALKRLDLSNGHYHASTMGELAAAFAGHSALEQLSFSHRPSEESYRAVAELLESTRLRRLAYREHGADGGDMPVDPAAIGVLAKARGLTELCLKGLVDGDNPKKARALLDAILQLEGLTTVHNLRLPEELEVEAADLLATSGIRHHVEPKGGLLWLLLDRKGLEHLTVETMYRMEEFLRELSDDIRGYTSLQTLRLDKGLLKAGSAKLVRKIIEDSPSLRRVELNVALPDDSLITLLKGFKRSFKKPHSVELCVHPPRGRLGEAVLGWQNNRPGPTLSYLKSRAHGFQFT